MIGIINGIKYRNPINPCHNKIFDQTSKIHKDLKASVHPYSKGVAAMNHLGTIKKKNMCWPL